MLAPLTEVLPEPAPKPDGQRFTASTGGWYELSGLGFGRRMVHLTAEDIAELHPDGDVPEAGRAGEAQKDTKRFVESLRMPDLTDEERAAFVAEAQGAVCSTCDGARVVPCAAHVAGDGCVDMLIDCPDCDPAADSVDPPYQLQEPWTGEGCCRSANYSEGNRHDHSVARDRTEGLDAAIEAAVAAVTRILETDPVGEDTSLLTHIHAAIRAAAPVIERAALLAAADDFEDDPFPDIADEVKWIYVEALRDRAGRTVAS
jgi:hypothetical protein